MQIKISLKGRGEMKNFWKKTSLFLVTTAMTVSAPLMAWALEHDIVILHTNDIHCGINDHLGFAGVAQLKKDALARTPNVALVDAGDAIQGAPIGKLSTGMAVVDIMNAVGYDFCIPGNHEFDYGMQRFLELVPKQKAGYYSANFIDLRTHKQVLSGYKILQFEDKKVAFVGVTTPETLSSSTPAFFQNEQGKYIYTFCEDKSGKKLYKQLQKNIDAVRKQGADYVFIVGHLGMNGSTKQWNSENIAKNTLGVDGIIDGHSHEKFERVVQNKKGKDVLLAQTGTKLKSVGQLVITPEGKLQTKLLTETNGKDAAVQKVIAQEMAIYDPLLKQPVGEALVTLHSYDPQTGKRIVRTHECALGDFVADAYKAVLNRDVAFVNGGNVRNEIKQGVVTYNDILESFPFGNECCVLKVKGSAILDALEMGAASYPEENGGFLQVAGLQYTINSQVPSGVVFDTKGCFVKVDGKRRVENVLIGGKPLDVNKEYTVGGTAYMLKFAGDGMTMFKGAQLVQNGGMAEVDAILDYVQNHLNAKIGEQYANAY
ncbi:MAG: bifunctional UDP-sugar hydrolase/5'-nucleotidase, partial [bacterium]|nr:bifunctional UDP-sugar hydrolase/5'-nucleotidase [bacterium]